MATQSVQQFLEQVESDQSLQEQFRQALEKENKREAVTELVQAKGYNFSPDELWEEVQKRQNEAQANNEAGELSDEELESVAGGFGGMSNFVSNIVTDIVPGAPDPGSPKEKKW